jgi:hypothetical protein
MIKMDYWQIAHNEINKAYQARQNRNEGMARVCARRAAGAAVKGYLSANKIPIPTPTSIDLLQDRRALEHIPQQLRSTMEHLTLRVGADHNLPAGIDLLSETTVLIETLQNLGSKEDSNGK